ncbi:MAG: radical SAM protein, partial [Deltaproteobacteria bacterium]|nr:radical SAM protein [Deltaproteobacteria bacterium]
MKPAEDITVTLACNNDCIFCPRTTLEHVKVRTPEELLPRLEAIRRGSRRVVLTGGEVTLIPSAPDLVALCRRLGFREIALITNGRALSDPNLASRLVQAGLTEACVTVYDLRPEVHDGLTRTRGSLEETLKGLENLLDIAARIPLSVRVNTLLCPSSADGIHALIAGLSDQGVRGFLVADAVLSEAFSEPVPHRRVREIASAVASDPDIDADVTWRGFPLCLFRGLDVKAEPQAIDTTIVDDRSLDAYYGEFFSNFEHVQACERCSEPSRCPGVQKRYLESLGAGEIAPIDASATPEAIARDLEGFEPWPDPGRLAVTPTTACQFRCSYCQVVLGRRHAAPGVLDRAVDLLLTSSRRRLELQFFGGEPLLRRAEVMRTMDRGRDLAAASNKRLHFTITTNGLLLDGDLIRFLEGHDAGVLFSLDGPRDVMERCRPPRRKGSLPFPAIERNLEALIRSSVPYFVNIVITPDGAADLPARVRHVADLGAQTVQICYALGPDWTPEARAVFCRGLAACAALEQDLRATGHRFRIQNLGSHAEPVILSTDLLVDVDGILYSDAALFAEKALPGLRDPYRIGSVFDLPSFDDLRGTREGNLEILRRTYPIGDPTRRTVEQHLEMGREVQAALDSIGDAPRGRTRDRNPLLET